jgi:hypothetical protein
VAKDPDIWVTTHASSERKQNEILKHARVHAGVAARIGWGGQIGIGTTLGLPSGEYTEGTLVIELRLGTTRELIWQAVAKDTLSNDGRKSRKSIGIVVGRAFEDYPPETLRSQQVDARQE